MKKEVETVYTKLFSLEAKLNGASLYSFNYTLENINLHKNRWSSGLV